MAGYNDLPDKEDMMKEMAEVKKSAKNRKIARKAMNILGINDGRIVEDNGTFKKEEEDEEEEEEEEGISQVAKTLGQETIEMLSNAKMRYRANCFTRYQICSLWQRRTLIYAAVCPLFFAFFFILTYLTVLDPKVS